MSEAELYERGRTLALEHADAVHAAGDEDAEARAALAVVAGAGLTAFTVPERDGGAPTAGLAPAETVSVRALCALRSGLAYGSGILDLMFVEQGLGSHPIALGGSDALRAEVLPDVVRGKRVSAFALTEEGAGSDLSGVALEARAAGDGFALSGAKTFISNAGLADFYTVLARTSGAPGERGGLTMFYVPADAPGLSIERFEVMAPHPIGTVRFDGTPVAGAHVLGEVGAGLELALANLARFRTSVAAAAAGFARRALDESCARLDSRTQFGRPLSSFQGLRFDLAEMDLRLRASELLIAEAAQAVDNGEPATAEVARAKLHATEAASWICDRAVQHFGGLGVKRGSVVERLYREVRALRIYEGTSEVQKLILAKDVLQRSRPQ